MTVDCDPCDCACLQANIEWYTATVEYDSVMASSWYTIMVGDQEPLDEYQDAYNECDCIDGGSSSSSSGGPMALPPKHVLTEELKAKFKAEVLELRKKHVDEMLKGLCP